MSQHRPPMGDTEVMDSQETPAPGGGSFPTGTEVMSAPAPSRAAATQPREAPTQPSAESIRPEPGPGLIIAGKFRVERLLGAGGMGAVYEGTQLTLARRVAIKTLHHHIAANPIYGRRFHREAYAVARLEHPNVVQIFDFGQDPATGVLYLVMEFLQGESLGDRLKQLSAPPPLAEVEEILLQVLDAFDVAHRAGIVHRDLKPDNIFLARDHAGRRVVKIVDFGIAHVGDAPDGDPALTRDGMIAGTPAYMSPEQCRSLAVGPAADLYAIGCVLTALLQLRPPFVAGTIMDIMTQQMYMAPPALERPPGSEAVPPLLERLRLDLLSKSPADRPQTAAEARERFVEAMSPEAARVRVPARKGDEPLGARADRGVQWHGSQDTVSDAARARSPRVVGLVRAGASEQGVGSACITGLAAQGITVVPVRSDAAPPGVVILDIGKDLELGRTWLRELARVSPASRAIVAMEDVSVEAMNALIEAGAAQVLAYPIRVDGLAKKLDRIRARS